MSLQLQLWRVENARLNALSASSLNDESQLEDWLEKDPSIIEEGLLIIGRQVRTAYGGKIDLLAIAQDGKIVVLELKRHLTTRDVVAQSLDYASWVQGLDYQQLDQICTKHRGKPLSELYQSYFGEAIGEINEAHRIIIVAAHLDESSERIVQYLAKNYELNINVAFFQFVRDGDREYLARAWLLDPEVVEEKSIARRQPEWSGYYFVNVGEGEHRNWEDNVEYRYIGAGHGPRYALALKKLKTGDRIFAYMKGRGYVGFGEITGDAAMIRDALGPNKQPLLQQPLKAPKASELKDDPEFSEWVVPVRWLKTFPRDHAKTFKGAFANQNIVCKLRDPKTAEFLKKEFQVSDNTTTISQ